MKRILFVLLLLSNQAFAADQWFCTEESGRRIGKTMQACGVGDGTSESEARKKALENAIEEFQSLCKISSDCKGRSTSVEPKRLTCAQYTDYHYWKCYRLIEVTLD